MSTPTSRSMPADGEKARALQAALAQIEKQFGKANLDKIRNYK